MKKVLIGIVSFLVFSECSLETRDTYFPKNHFESLNSESKGLYVYYQDKRNSEERLTGILKTDNSNYICRTISLKSKKIQMVRFKIKYTGTEYRIIPEKSPEKLDKNVLLPSCIVDINHIVNQYLRLDRSKFPDEINLEDEWPEYGYTMVHRFQFWIPFFNYLGSSKKDKPMDYTLIKLGRHFEGNHSSNFYKINSIPEYKSLPGYKINPLESRKIQYNEISFRLDGNWKSIDPDKFNFPGLLGFYWIAKKTLRDSQINIEKLSMNKLNVKNIYDLIQITIPFNNIIPSSNKVYSRNGRIIHEFDNIDPESGYINHSISIFISMKDENVYSINISGFRDIIIENYDYFLKILDSVSIK